MVRFAIALLLLLACRTSSAVEPATVKVQFNTKFVNQGGATCANPGALAGVAITCVGDAVASKNNDGVWYTTGPCETVIEVTRKENAKGSYNWDVVVVDKNGQCFASAGVHRTTKELALGKGGDLRATNINSAALLSCTAGTFLISP